MPYEPIHHKYRPQTFKDLVGQETIALTLSNALKQEKIAPAYLFTGPRGTGKTSSARILAKSLNCLNTDQPTPDPCGECEVCLAIAQGTALDVMEIDAASNTGVDNIREIIERSRFAPVQCRYKIYAIDECHMLSTAAFNALLKTLEEPPPQVVFILATTDPQRVLSTIISRCQRFDYRRIPLPEMVSHLKYIAEAEKIAIADDALTLIAQIANGGLRDAESLLDQLSLLPDQISVAKVWDLVGAVPEQDLLKLLQAINRNNSVEVLEQCRSLLDRGREPIVVLQNLASFYLNLLIAKTAPQRPDMVAVTETCWQQLCSEANNWQTNSILKGQNQLKEAETQLKRTTQPRLWLEVTLLSLLPQAEQAVVVNSQPQIVIPNTASVISPPALEQPSQPMATPQSIEHADHNQQTVNHPPDISTPAPEKSPAKIDSPSTSIAEAKPVSQPLTPAADTIIDAQAAINNNLDLENIWRQVITCLQPPTTQALLKQQCHLINFDGSSAIVGISSATLQKLNQGKVPNIEKAFAQVVQHKVKVQLEVASAKQNLAKKNSVIAKQPVESSLNNSSSLNKIAAQEQEHNSIAVPASIATPSQSDLTSATPKVVKTQLDNNGHHEITKAINNRVQLREETKINSPSIQPKIESPDIAANVVSLDLEPELDANYEQNDLQKAIASLTQSFEGELVQLGNSQTRIVNVTEIDEPEKSIQHPEQTRPSLEEYDDDW